MRVVRQDTSLSAILIADDPALANALQYLFSVILKYDFEVHTNSDEAWSGLAPTIWPRVLLLHADGVDHHTTALIDQAKSVDRPPVVIALQNSGSPFGAAAFLAGADDVVDWPCSLHEFALRLFVRLGQSPKLNAALLQDVSWETEAYISERANLTTSEAQVMRILLSKDGSIVSRDDLSLAVDGRPWRYGDRKFDVHVAKIRKKLSDAFGPSMSVTTVRSLGYCLSMDGKDTFGMASARGRV